MAIIGCKYCGKPLSLLAVKSVSTCPSCGMQTTLPVLTDPMQAEAFQAGNAFRLYGQYERGKACFDRLLNEDPQNCEAYWQRALCRFGVAYHEDLTTYDYVPVCHLADGQGFPNDPDCIAAIRYADATAARVYRKEAARIAASGQERSGVKPSQSLPHEQSGKKPVEEMTGFTALTSFDTPSIPSAAPMQAPMQTPSRQCPSIAPDTVSANLAERGFLALEDGDTARAGAFFEQALSQDLHCAKAYWGKVLLSERCTGDDELVRKHTETLKKIQPQRAAACPPDIERGRRLTKKYTAMGLLSADEISEKLQFNITFPSRSAELKRQKDNETTFWSNQKNYQRALRYADNAFASRLQLVQSKILAEYDRCIAEEDAKDRKIAEQLRAAYAAHMDQCEKQLEQLYHTRIQEYYEAAVALEESAATEQDYQTAAEHFRPLRNYAEAAKHLRICEENAKQAAETANAAQKTKQRKKVKRMRIFLASGAAVLLLAVAAFAVIRFVLPARAYMEGETALSEKRYEDAIDAFEKAGSYRNASDRVFECYYEQGLHLAQSGDPQGADAAFRAADGYSDANAHLGEGFYLQAEQQLADGDYAGAADSFRQAGSYSDASTQVLAAYYAAGEAALSDGDCAAAADAFTNARSYSDAAERIGEGYYAQGKREYQSKHYTKAMELFEAAQGYSDSAEYLAKCSYQSGEESLNAGKFSAAYDAYCTAGSYSDAADKAAALLAEHPNVAHLGDVITFGAMDQDKSQKGNEPLEWYVLENDDGKLLLLAKEGLDGRAYYNQDNEVTWENSSVREWLNNKFYKNSFSKKEKAKIIEQEVPADDNPHGVTTAGRATTSRIFLLGLSEAEHYGELIPDIMLCKVVPVADQVWTSSTNNNCWWWLRTPGNTERTAITVDSAGEINYVGSNVSYTRAAVRPAMWVDMNETS